MDRQNDTYTTEKNYGRATSLGCVPTYRGASEPTPTATMPHVGCNSFHVKLSFASHAEIFFQNLK